jgi:hypothetical protein
VALTLRNWAFFAVVGCAVAVIAFWPTPIKHPDFLLFETRSATEIIHRAIRQTESALTVLERRDGVLASLKKEPPLPGGPRIKFDLALAPAAQRALTNGLDAVATGLRPYASDVRTMLVFTSDPNRREVSASWYLLPDATDGRTCLVLQFLDENTRQFLNTAGDMRLDELQSRMSRQLGPCAFYTAFGKPGAGVERWLREYNYVYAWSTDWQIPNVPLDLAEDLSDASLSDLLQHLVRPAETWGGQPLSVRACAHGNQTQCRTVLSLSDRYWGTIPPLGTRYAVARGWYNWGDSRERVMQTFLADLVQFTGRDRFERFWRSPLPRDSAFATTIGMSIEEYTHRWLQGKFPAVHYGPYVAVGSILLGLVLLAAMVSVTGLYASRRQVG